MTNNDKVITRIRKLREEKNIRQAVVAKKLGITPAAYNKLENGHTQLTVNNLYLIAEVLKVTAGNLLEAPNHNTFNIKTNISSAPMPEH